MKLGRKKELAARALGVGVNRIVFNSSRLNEIKEAITKQDMRDLAKDKAIVVREVGGRLKIERRKIRRRQGSVRKKVSDKKGEYMVFVRNLRSHIGQLKQQKKIMPLQFQTLQREIRSKKITNKSQIKEYLAREAKK